MKICAIADVHMQDITTPPADVLVVAGDLTWRGKLIELYKFRDWLVKQPQKHKIIVAGNHDFCFENNSTRQDAEITMGGDGIIYLRDQLISIDGVSFYGTPWQPWFYDWAFNLPRGEKLREKWDMIPEGIDVLITHGPPYGYGDTTSRGERVGCDDLADALDRVKPKFHVFGHIHEDTGSWDKQHGDGSITKIINCSVGPKHDYKSMSDAGSPVLFEIVR